MRGLLDLGAVGYVLKDDAEDAVVRAVRAAMAGSRWLSPAVLEVLLRPAADPGPEALTPREHEVLALVAEGRTSKEIGLTLGIGTRTADFHVKNVLAKLGARTRAEALHRAHQHGLLSAFPASDAEPPDL